ncbi:Patellin-4 [Turnera subulata]|uniref:Patellin-4 n=1 Tax=Turnera subulata TaxID=218843 RepID=A0A9Q0GIN1_9ROSI|nr:Patellin-4 [Turnera subulata]
MTVKVEDTLEVAQPDQDQQQQKKVVDESSKTDVDVHDSKPTTVQKSSSYKEESNFLSDLKERKALNDLKSKLQEAILQNTLFIKKQEPKKKLDKEAAAGEEDHKAASQQEKKAGEQDQKDKETATKEADNGHDDKLQAEGGEAAKINEEEEEEEEEEDEEKNKAEEEEEGNVEVEEEINKDISLWGIPLFPSKGTEGNTDVVLLKFLRAREFKVNDAFEMLRKTLQWRKESGIASILEEELEVDLSPAFYMNGVDRQGHPVCYNIYGVFGDEELYAKALGTEEKRKQFLRWRFQLMEKGIQKLDLKPGGVTSLLQISDLKNSPPPSKKELRSTMNQAVGVLQDNYPEFVSKNVFINVPFWYYALSALLSPFLTQRTKSKFVVARPAKTTETLLKYIPAEEIPAQYGGFKRDNDFEFSSQDGEVSEVLVKAGSTESIEIPATEVGATLLWDLTVLGWEVNYKEEFVPNDEASYTIIIRKSKKMSTAEEPVRNTFRNNEPGKVVLTIQNNSSKKKRVLYRYKSKKSASY